MLESKASLTEEMGELESYILLYTKSNPNWNQSKQEEAAPEKEVTAVDATKTLEDAFKLQLRLILLGQVMDQDVISLSANEKRLLEKLHELF